MNRHDLEESHLHCDMCSATPAFAADARNVSDASFGYDEGSDCPACDDGELVRCEDYEAVQDNEEF